MDHVVDHITTHIDRAKAELDHLSTRIDTSKAELDRLKQYLVSYVQAAVRDHQNVASEPVAVPHQDIPLAAASTSSSTTPSSCIPTESHQAHSIGSNEPDDNGPQMMSGDANTGGDSAQVVNRVEAPNPQPHPPSSLICQPSTSSAFAPFPHPQHTFDYEPENDQELLADVKRDDVKEEHDDDDDDREDEGEYMSDCDEECEDCAKGICQSNQTRENDNTNKDDADTNAHNVTVNIKTESMDSCDLVKEEEHDEDDEEDEEDRDILIKQEIKEECEDDHEDDCDRGEVKREMVSDDDDDNSIQLDDSLNSDEVVQPNLNEPMVTSSPPSQLTSPTNSVPQCAASATEQMQVPNSSSVIGESVDQAVINRENALAGEMNQQDLAGHDEQLLNTLNEPNELTRVTQSAELFSPSTSTGQDSSRTDLTQQATVSTRRNGTKRKQTQPNRTVKRRSKKTLQDGDGENRVDGEDIDKVGREVANGTKRKRTQPKRTVKRSGQEATGEEIATESTTNPVQPNLTKPNRHFQCPQCPKSFDHKFSLQRHLRVHTNERPFACEQCDKRFKERSTLVNHQLIHQNVKNFQCHECDQRFTQKTNLDSHLRTHSGDRPFACRHCEMSFAQANTRHDHEQSIHLLVKSYRCKECGHTATRRTHLLTHIRVVHFGLPQTIKQQRELNIIDERDPRELMEKV